jgi:hypothetical protein
MAVKIVAAMEPPPRSCDQDARARRLQGCGPPQQIVDQRPGGRLQLGQSRVDIAALVVRPQGRDRDVTDERMGAS